MLDIVGQLHMKGAGLVRPTAKDLVAKGLLPMFPLLRPPLAYQGRCGRQLRVSRLAERLVNPHVERISGEVVEYFELSRSKARPVRFARLRVVSLQPPVHPAIRAQAQLGGVL